MHIISRNNSCVWSIVSQLPPIKFDYSLEEELFARKTIAPAVKKKEEKKPKEVRQLWVSGSFCKGNAIDALDIQWRLDSLQEDSISEVFSFLDV